MQKNRFKRSNNAAIVAKMKLCGLMCEDVHTGPALSRAKRPMVGIISFFGDYSSYVVHKKNLKHFMEGFTEYSKLKNTSKLLYRAIEETKIFLFGADRPQRCYICLIWKKHSHELSVNLKIRGKVKSRELLEMVNFYEK